MGLIRHHGIIVTSGCGPERIREAWIKAVEIFDGFISAITDSPVNGYQSFLIVPDGSKEGWDRSYEGNKRRKEFIHWLKINGGGFDWVEICYGDELGKSEIINDSHDRFEPATIKPKPHSEIVVGRWAAIVLLAWIKENKPTDPANLRLKDRILRTWPELKD